MTSDLVEVLIDTNAFIQLRDLRDLPWREIFPGAKRINLIVASQVIEELDKFKNSTNNRKRDRARLALRVIETASQNDNHSLVVRSDPFEIRIVISRASPPDWAALPRLDRAKPDDQLVAEALSYGNDAVLFSYDTGPRIRARLADIRAFGPMDDWHLPQEKTDDQRKITELEKNLERALATFPKIIAGFDTPGATTSDIEIRIPILCELHPSSVDSLAEAYLKQYPREHIAAQRSDTLWLVGNRLGGHTEYDVEHYEKEYSAFRKSVNRYFTELHNGVFRAAHTASLPYFVQNDSGVSASGLRIEVSVEGKAALLASKDAAVSFVGSLTPPTPPKKPKSRSGWDVIPPAISPHLFRNEPRDPTNFFWFDRPEYGSKNSALQCEDFRATRLWQDEVILLPDSALPLEGQVSLEVSATNLPAPVKLTAIVRFEEYAADWDDQKVRHLLPDAISTLLNENS